jgi:carbonic anhydrase
MKRKNKPLMALLWGLGFFAFTQGIGYAIVAAPRNVPMPKGSPQPSARTDFTPTPATPTVGEGSYLHPTAKVLGEVQLGARVWVGPRASIRADLGHSIIIGDNSNLQDGVVIWGNATEAEGKPLSGRSTLAPVATKGSKPAPTNSVNIGNNVSILPQAQVVGPSVIEAEVFIGAGALVFQSRVGTGSIIEPGAQLINVNLGPNTYVAAGQIISNPGVAKRLPRVDPSYSRAKQNQETVTLYGRLALGYLGVLEPGVSAQQKELWRNNRKEALWMPSIPLPESPYYKIPESDSDTQRSPQAITMGDITLRGSFVGAGAILRADHGGKIEAEGAIIEEGAILVATQEDLLPAPSSLPTSAPTSLPGDVPATPPLLPVVRPPINELRPIELAPTPATEPATQSTQEKRLPGIYLGLGATVEASALIYSSTTIHEGAKIKSRAIIIGAEIGANAVVAEGAVVFRVYIPDGKLVPPGKSITTQEDALSLPTVPGFFPESTPTSYPTVAKTSGRASSALSADALATSELTVIVQGAPKLGANVYVSDHSFLLLEGAGALLIEAGAHLQSGAFLWAKGQETLKISSNAVISAQAFLGGKTSIGEGSLIGPRAMIQDSTIGRGAVVEPGAIVLNTNVPEGAVVSAGMVLTRTDAAVALLAKESPWRTMQGELLFAGKSFAGVYATNPRAAELRGSNKKANSPNETSAWDTLFSPEGIILTLLVLGLLGVLVFGVRESEKD